MAKQKIDVYMPLIIGDWLKGTRGMKASVKGVYIGLLLYQWDNGFIPENLDDLALIEPEVGSVWVSISHKFPVVAPGQRQNSKCEEVRTFFEKQRKNGSNGGRPKKDNPDVNPNSNPNQNPNPNPPFGLELGIEDNFEKEGGVGETIGETIDFKLPDVSGDDITMPFETEPMRKLWAAWKEARWRNHGVRYRQFGEQADLRRLQGMTFQQVEQAIQQAIAANWKNLYPEKNGTGKQTRKETTSDLAIALAERVRATPGQPSR